MFRIPSLTDAPLQSRPWTNCLLVLANVLAFVVQINHPQVMGHYMLEAHSLRLSQFLTYAFLHISPGHLIFNMFVLWMLGNNINDRLGHLGYLAFYLAAGVFAGIGFVAAGGEAMVGASGAIGGVMGVYLALLPRTNIRLRLGSMAMDSPAMYFIVVFFIYNVLMSFIGEIAVQQVAYEAHIAGMVFGFAVGMVLLWLTLVPRHEQDMLAVLRKRPVATTGGL